MPHVQPHGGLHLNISFNEHTGEKGTWQTVFCFLKLPSESRAHYTHNASQASHLIQRGLRTDNLTMFPEGRENKNM